MRNFSAIDRVIDQIDQTLKAAFVPPPRDPFPETIPREEGALSPADRDLGARLMRVNHAGEVAAQALYQGHALCAAHSGVYEAMRDAGRDELSHLHWTSARLKELNGHRSLLTPIWYLGSFAIGASTALLGDAMSLGFVAETERQVVTHLEGHLARLSKTDQKTRVILEHMVADEARHATRALEAGGRSLPLPMRWAMRLASQVMTRTAFWL